MLDKTYSIAFTHAPVSAELREKARKEGVEIVHIPLLLCGVVPAYHVAELKGKTPLNFTGEVLADIFLGKIKHWNDPALKAINPGVKLPAKKITVVHREDSSGTTDLFTEYLAAVSPAWKEQVGPAAAEVKWPVGIAVARNPGVAAKIHEIDGAIGYVDRLYTSFQDIVLDYGAVQNKDKSAFVRAEPANLTAAARAILAEIPDDLTFNLIDKPGKDSYPITGVIYAVCSDRQPEASRKQIVDFLRWATHEGQADVVKTSFAPLPPELVQRVDRRLDAIKRRSLSVIAPPTRGRWGQSNGPCSPYLAESPYSKCCGISCSVALPSLNLMIQRRSKTWPCQTGGLATPSAVTKPGIALCDQQIKTIFPSYSGLARISLTISADSS